MARNRVDPSYARTAQQQGGPLTRLFPAVPRPWVEMKRRYCAGMSRSLTLVLGAVLVLMGLLWTGQGLGWIGGSPMTGVTLWAVVGPLAALVGVVLIVRGARHFDGHER